MQGHYMKKKTDCFYTFQYSTNSIEQSSRKKNKNGKKRKKYEISFVTINYCQNVTVTIFVDCANKLL